MRLLTPRPTLEEQVWTDPAVSPLGCNSASSPSLRAAALGYSSSCPLTCTRLGDAAAVLAHLPFSWHLVPYVPSAQEQPKTKVSLQPPTAQAAGRMDKTH